MVRLDQNSLLKALNRAGDGVVVADGEGRVVLWNRAAERLLGWSAPEAVGRTSCELLDARNDGRPCGEACPIRAAARKGVHPGVLAPLFAIPITANRPFRPAEPIKSSAPVKLELRHWSPAELATALPLSLSLSLSLLSSSPSPITR